MTRSEMIEFIKENPYVHITHPLFADDEFIYLDTDGIVRDENGYVFENGGNINGIRMRTGGMWENGWSIKE